MQKVREEKVQALFDSAEAATLTRSAHAINIWELYVSPLELEVREVREQGLVQLHWQFLCFKASVAHTARLVMLLDGYLHFPVCAYI